MHITHIHTTFLTSLKAWSCSFYGFSSALRQDSNVYCISLLVVVNQIVFFCHAFSQPFAVLCPSAMVHFYFGTLPAFCSEIRPLACTQQLRWTQLCLWKASLNPVLSPTSTLASNTSEHFSGSHWLKASWLYLCILSVINLIMIPCFSLDYKILEIMYCVSFYSLLNFLNVSSGFKALDLQFPLLWMGCSSAIPPHFEDSTCLWPSALDYPLEHNSSPAQSLNLLSSVHSTDLRLKLPLGLSFSLNLLFPCSVPVSPSQTVISMREVPGLCCFCNHSTWNRT